MSIVHNLLTFPGSSSDAFAAYPALNISAQAKPSGSDHPRKTPRLADDLDSASASRSRAATTQTSSNDEQKSGPIVLKILGAFSKPAAYKLDEFADRCYDTVDSFLRAFLVRDNKTLPATYEAVYQACRIVVLNAGKGEALYNKLKQTIEKCVRDLAKELLGERQKGVKWIAPFIEICVWFEGRVGLLQSLLAYLDRVYLQERKDMSSIRSLAFREFGDRIFGSPQVTECLRAGLQEWIDWERENRMGHELRPQIMELISHLISHDQYSAAFESFYVDTTKAYYKEESTRMAEEMKSDPAGFTIHCISRVKEEVQRADEMLSEATCSLVRATVESALVENRVAWVASQGLPKFMETENLPSLCEMYSLFMRVGHHAEVLKSFKSYVLNTVRVIVDDREREDKMVQRLLEFRAFADKVLHTAFVDQAPISPAASTSQHQLDLQTVPNQEFTYAMADAFQAGFKSRRNKPAEMIAKYLDKIMRKGQKDASDADFNDLLDQVLALYRFTDDKDVFRKYYHRALAKRLLTSRTASDDFEKSVLKRLKEKYDPEFDMGENMFKDIALSKDLVDGYRDSQAKGKGKANEEDDEGDDPKFTVMVLQQSVWPFSTTQQNIDLPQQLQDQVTGFTEFYKNNHNGRVLNWDHSLGNATVKARFKAGQKELSVSLHQAVVVLLFNDEEKISFKSIKDQTSMEDADLRRTLQSLACGNKKVLKKKPVGRDVNDDDTFYFNPDFTHPRYQVRIDSIQAKETPEEAKKTEDGIQTDRTFVIDAAIVRVMKARKERTFEQLKIDVVDAVKQHFIPDMKHFKVRVDSLVEGEFLRRDEENRDLFYYVA